LSTVVALGGNALTRRGERGTAAEQLANLRQTVAALRPLLTGEDALAITHGNGPQVGNELLRHERAAEEAPPLPLWLAVAQTQAEIGALIEAALRPVLEPPVACVITHVLVAEEDGAFQHPTKPIGPFYSESRAHELERDRGWDVVEDANRGWRRVVPSPTPLEIVELEAVRTLLRGGTVTIACGGGGIPVVRRDGRLQGVDAVIDKDRASALLAERLGADRLVILTDVPAVYSGFGGDRPEELRELTTAEAESLLPQLAAGSMRPKVEASVSFTRAGGEALVTSAEALERALAGEAGTRFKP
jgi:carbamate kinase